MVRKLLTPTLLVCLVISLSPAVFAATDIGFKGVGPRIGFIDPEGAYDGTVELGVDVNLGTWAKQLYWDLSGTYWSAGQNYHYLNRAYDWSVRDIAFRSGVNYHFIEGDWEPFAGGGIGMHFFSWDYAGYNGPAFDNGDTDFGFYIDGGVQHKFSAKMSGDAIIRFDLADPNQTALVLQLMFGLGK